MRGGKEGGEGAGGEACPPSNLDSCLHLNTERAPANPVTTGGGWLACMRARAAALMRTEPTDCPATLLSISWI